MSQTSSRHIATRLAFLLGLLGTALLSSCDNTEQTEHCRYVTKPKPCPSREELAKTFTYLDGHGPVTSIDEGPRETSDPTSRLCCYTVTYEDDHQD